MRKWLALAAALILLLAAVPTAVAATPAGAFGVVLDQAGRPVASADIEFYELGTGLAATLTTGADGAFRLERQAEQGSLWQIRVWAKGYRTKESGWISLTQSPYQSLTLERMTGGLQVTVRDEHGLAPGAGMAAVVGPGGQLVTQRPLDGGRFVEPDLLAGDYRVLVSVPGYVPVSRSLTVGAGRVASAVVALERSGFTVTGQLRDAVTGGPVGGAAVELQRADGSRAASAISEGSGWFRLPAPQEPDGSYRVWVTAGGYRGVLTQPVSLTQGQEYDLTAAVGAIQLQPGATNLTGTLLNPWGRPMEGINKVVLLLQGYGQVAEARTTGNGQFHFDNVPAGPGYHYALLAPDLYYRSILTWTELQPGTAQVALSTQAGKQESAGRASLSGTVDTATGLPISGAKVELIYGSRVLKTAATDATGSFLFEELDATQGRYGSTDPYMLRISKEGFITTMEVSVAGQSQIEIPLPDARRTTVQAVLRPEAAAAAGRVTDTSGAPLAGATVLLQPDNGQAALTATTDAGGAYRIADVKLAGGARYALRVEAKGYLTRGWTDVTDAVLNGLAVPPVRLSSGGATFSGQVLGPSGETERGVSVMLQGPAGEQLGEATTDDAGYWRIAAGTPRSGLLMLTASLSGWSRAVADFTAAPEPGATVTRDMVIFPETGSLEGRALSAAGAQSAGVQVDLLEEGKGVIRSLQTDENGYYRFDQIPLTSSGWFSLRVRARAGGDPVAFGGSLTHRTELVPMLRLAPGERTVTDLLVGER